MNTSFKGTNREVVEQAKQQRQEGMSRETAFCALAALRAADGYSYGQGQVPTDSALALCRRYEDSHRA